MTTTHAEPLTQHRQKTPNTKKPFTTSPYYNTPHPWPGEHIPPVPTHTPLYNTPQTTLINAYIPWNAATIHTLHVVSFFTVQKTICCNETSSAPDDGRIISYHIIFISIDLYRIRNPYGYGKRSHNHRVYKTIKTIFVSLAPCNLFDILR